MADAVPHLSELVEVLEECFLNLEPRFEGGPRSLANDRVLKLPKIGELKLAGKSVVPLQVESRILFGCTIDAVIYLLDDMLRHSADVARKRAVHDAVERELDGFDL